MDASLVNHFTACALVVIGAAFYADQCSIAYQVGEWSPAVFGGARLAYAGGAKAISLLPGLSGADASAARNGLKAFFRGYMFSDYRAYSYEDLVDKYGTDAGVKAAAGRTDSSLNALGAAGVAGSGVNSEQCGCKH